MSELSKVRKARAAESKHLTNALRGLMGSPDGRVFLRWMFDLTDMFGAAFTGNALTTAHITGRQEIGKRLWVALSAADIGLFVSFLKENANVQHMDAGTPETAGGDESSTGGDEPDS